jgi:hypothetical protein
MLRIVPVDHRGSSWKPLATDLYLHRGTGPDVVEPAGRLVRPSERADDEIIAAVTGVRE